MHTLLSIALSTVLLLQGLVPAGYMPESLEEGGWLVKLCPDGLPSSFPAAASNDDSHAHHGSHHGASGAHAEGGARDYCPLGSAFDTVAVAALASPDHAAENLSGPRRSAYLSPRLAARLAPAQPRAPPIS